MSRLPVRLRRRAMAGAPPTVVRTGGALMLAFGMASAVTAQAPGTIRGVVSDKDFEAPLPNARVTIVELDRTVETGDQGNYVFQEVPPGVYTLLFAKDGYVRQPKGNVVVSPGEFREVNVSLSGDFTDLEEFVVQEALALGTGNEAALLQLRFQSPQLLDSVSAELLSRAGASDAAAALRLVAGATVQDNNSAVIRGLPDRYVSSQLNGLIVPSADADKRAVELDQFPSAAIESIQVSKTFTPDQQGDASGGAVDVRLKGIPDQEFVFRVNAQIGVNSQVRNRSDFLTYEGGGVSFSGEDNGNRAIQTENIGGNWEGAVGVSRDDAPTDFKWSMATGASHEFENGLRIGAFGTAFYERDTSFYDNGRDDSLVIASPGEPLTPQPIQGGFGPGDLITGLLDVTQASQQVQWGTLLSAGAEYEDLAKLDVNYLFTRTTEDTVTEATDTRGKFVVYPGYDPNDITTPGHSEPQNAPFLRRETLNYEERTIETLQVRGEGKLPVDEFLFFDAPTVEAAYAVSKADSETPDKRQFASFWTPARMSGMNLLPPRHSNLNPAANVNLGNVQRIYENVTEESDQYFVNLKLPFEQWTETEGYLKFGYFQNDVQRSFNQDAFNNGNDPSEYFGAFDDLWSANFPFEDHPIIESPFDVDYEGELEVAAWYLMSDLPLTDNLHLVGGFRMERTQINIVNFPEEDAFWFPPDDPAATQTQLNPGDADVAFSTESPLPALALIYDPIPEVTLRASYAETIARQTFKELTPIFQSEFVGGPLFIGNPNLRNSEVKNYDLRADYRPYAGGLFSVSWFHKDLTDPIEFVQSAGNGIGSFTTAVNYPEGEITGTEIETRHDLGELFEPLTGLSIGANATFLNARVSLTDAEQEVLARPAIDVPTQRRDASNTPKYLYNLYLTYDVPRAGTRIGLFYTVTGDTLVAGAGQSSRNDYIPDVYRKEFDNLNLTISQAFGKYVTLRFQAKNLTNPGIEQVYRSRVLPVDTTQSYFTRGIDYSLSLAGQVQF